MSLHTIFFNFLHFSCPIFKQYSIRSRSRTVITVTNNEAPKIQALIHQLIQETPLSFLSLSRFQLRPALIMYFAEKGIFSSTRSMSQRLPRLFPTYKRTFYFLLASSGFAYDTLLLPLRFLMGWLVFFAEYLSPTVFFSFFQIIIVEVVP